MTAAIPVSAWELPGEPGEVVAVYVDGVELARDGWVASGVRVNVHAPIPVPPARRGEALVEALVWVGRYPPAPSLTALVRRPGGTDVVDARPVAQA